MAVKTTYSPSTKKHRLSWLVALLAGGCTAEAAMTPTPVSEADAKENFITALLDAQSSEIAMAAADTEMTKIDAARTTFRQHLSDGTCDGTLLSNAVLKKAGVTNMQCVDGLLMDTFPNNGKSEAGFFGHPIYPDRVVFGGPEDVSSQFGKRCNALKGRKTCSDDEKEWHNGVDIRTQQRSLPVYATHDGCIAFAGRRGEYGKLITVYNREHKTVSYYGHLNKFSFTADPTREGGLPCVKKGDKIGMSGGAPGKDGRSSGPHLHYEIYIGGKAQNPVAVHKASVSAAPRTDDAMMVKLKEDALAKLETYAEVTYDAPRIEAIAVYQKAIDGVEAAWAPVHAAKRDLVAAGWTAADVDAITDACTPNTPCKKKDLRRSLGDLRS